MERVVSFPGFTPFPSSPKRPFTGGGRGGYVGWIISIHEETQQ